MQKTKRKGIILCTIVILLMAVIILLTSRRDEIFETLEDEFNEACESLIKDILYTNDKIFSKMSELKYLELKEAEYLEEKRGVANV